MLQFKYDAYSKLFLYHLLDKSTKNKTTNFTNAEKANQNYKTIVPTLGIKHSFLFGADSTIHVQLSTKNFQQLFLSNKVLV